MKINQCKSLGQIYTTRCEYILQGFDIPNYDIIEPFAGQGDLVEYIHLFYPNKKVECYDIDPKRDYIVRRDTLLNPPSYNNKYVITNPPYVSRNKTENKILFDKYNVNDLYKCFIKTLCQEQVLGGIFIIPLNFWSSMRKMDIELRGKFIDLYDVQKINIFEEDVFDDTTYTVCSTQFIKKETNKIDKSTIITFYPSCDVINTEILSSNNYMIGGEIYNLPKSDKYTISRLTLKNKKNTNLLIKCIDDNSNNRICMSYVKDSDIYVDRTTNCSARSYATLTITPVLNENEQRQLAEKFNLFLNTQRNKYHSLFLANYRESNDMARKRISFTLVYNIVEYILNKSYLEVCDLGYQIHDKH